MLWIIKIVQKSTSIKVPNNWHFLMHRLRLWLHLHLLYWLLEKLLQLRCLRILLISITFTQLQSTTEILIISFCAIVIFTAVILFLQRHKCTVVDSDTWPQELHEWLHSIVWNFSLWQYIVQPVRKLKNLLFIHMLSQCCFFIRILLH